LPAAAAAAAGSDPASGWNQTAAGQEARHGSGAGPMHSSPAQQAACHTGVRPACSDQGSHRPNQDRV
jgi:hypothetical protein